MPDWRDTSRGRSSRRISVQERHHRGRRGPRPLWWRVRLLSAEGKPELRSDEACANVVDLLEVDVPVDAEGPEVADAVVKRRDAEHQRRLALELRSLCLCHEHGIAAEAERDRGNPEVPAPPFRDR